MILSSLTTLKKLKKGSEGKIKTAKLALGKSSLQSNDRNTNDGNTRGHEVMVLQELLGKSNVFGE